MDRNVFVAIALSMSVLLFWGAFFETPKKTSEQQTNQKVEQKNEQGSIAPVSYTHLTLPTTVIV